MAGENLECDGERFGGSILRRNAVRRSARPGVVTYQHRGGKTGTWHGNSAESNTSVLSDSGGCSSYILHSDDDTRAAPEKEHLSDDLSTVGGYPAAQNGRESPPPSAQIATAGPDLPDTAAAPAVSADDEDASESGSLAFYSSLKNARDLDGSHGEERRSARPRRNALRRRRRTAERQNWPGIDTDISLNEKDDEISTSGPLPGAALPAPSSDSSAAREADLPEAHRPRTSGSSNPTTTTAAAGPAGRGTPSEAPTGGWPGRECLLSWGGVPSGGRAGPAGRSALTAATETVTTETFVDGGVTYTKQTSVTCYVASELVDEGGGGDGEGRSEVGRRRSLPCRPGIR